MVYLNRLVSHHNVPGLELFKCAEKRFIDTKIDGHFYHILK